MENSNPYLIEASRAAEMYKDAHELDSLSIYTDEKRPDDAFDMWKDLTKGGSLFSKFRKGDESPAITYKRFIKKKNEEFSKKRGEFLRKYGFDYTKVNMKHSDSMQVKDFDSNILAI